MKMFRGISLSEFTQLEQLGVNTSNYSPIHARLTQKALEDDFDFHKDPWRIKPMIITMDRQYEFIETITRQDYLFQRLCGTYLIRGMNAMLYWILNCQKATYQTYATYISEVDFLVNDLYLTLKPEERRKIPIQCSADEWDEAHIKVKGIEGVEGNEVQIRDSDDDLYGPDSEDYDSEDEDPEDPHHSAGLVEEDDIDIDATQTKDFTRYYWCAARTDEVE